MTRVGHLLMMLCAALLLVSFPALAQNFPKLTGRVVDQAELLTPAQEAELSAKTEALEKSTGRQFVIATVTSLNDQEIADYSYQLGRHWKIGDEKRDDGVVMVVAPKERKVWIATGYGAEGFLPDILIGRIVRDTILPRFKAGDMAGGIAAGADAAIAQLSLSPDEAAQRAQQIEAAEAQRSDRRGRGVSIFPVIFIVVIFFTIIGSIARAAGGRRYRGKGGRRGGLDAGDVAVILWGLDALSRGSRGGGGWGGGGWGGGGGGGFGDFSGGGGSFGGGGAGGSW
jgi:uncharacterized protein